MIQRDALGDGIDGIDDVVHPANQLVDVFAIKRRDERAIEPIQRLMREVIGFVFVVADLLQLGADIGKRPPHFPQMLRRRDRVARDVLEQIEKNGVLRQQVDHGAPNIKESLAQCQRCERR